MHGMTFSSELSSFQNSFILALIDIQNASLSGTDFTYSILLCTFNYCSAHIQMSVHHSISRWKHFLLSFSGVASFAGGGKLGFFADAP